MISNSQVQHTCHRFTTIVLGSPPLLDMQTKVYWDILLGPRNSPRQVGRLHTGTELCWPRSLTEHVRCRKSGGRSCMRLSGPKGESPPKILKESSSGLTVSASDSEVESSPVGARSGSRLSRYSTSSSGSLSVTTQQADVSPSGVGTWPIGKARSRSPETLAGSSLSHPHPLAHTPSSPMSSASENSRSLTFLSTGSRGPSSWIKAEIAWP